MEEDVKKEIILSKMDFAIQQAKYLHEYKSKGLVQHLIDLLIEIEKDVKDY